MAAAASPGAAPAWAAGTATPAGGRRRLTQAAAALHAAAGVLRSEPAMASAARSLAARAEDLAGGRFTMALFGAFSAGKSSFANALLGRRGAARVAASGNGCRRADSGAGGRLRPWDGVHHHEAGGGGLGGHPPFLQRAAAGAAAARLVDRSRGAAADRRAPSVRAAACRLPAGSCRRMGRNPVRCSEQSGRSAWRSTAAWLQTRNAPASCRARTCIMTVR
ncbi:hypothetical protein ACFTAO_29535 [Paenibacillus rhizoplanae]